MSDLDSFTSLESIVAKLRAEHEASMKTLQDQLLAANLETTMYKDALDRATDARAAADRVVAALLAQFGMVSVVFEQAKALALEHGFQKEPPSGEIAEGAPVVALIAESPNHVQDAAISKE